MWTRVGAVLRVAAAYIWQRVRRRGGAESQGDKKHTHFIYLMFCFCCVYPLVACARRRALVLRTRRKNWTPLETVGVEIVSGAFVVLRDGRIRGGRARFSREPCSRGVRRGRRPSDARSQSSQSDHCETFSPLCVPRRPAARCETTQIRAQRYLVRVT